MSEELKPCPFCGSTPELHSAADDTYGEAFAIIECLACDQSSVMAKRPVSEHAERWSRDEAVSAWNTRTPSPDVQSLVEALLDTTAALAAAVSLLERSEKTAAPSDKMFDTMLDDYRASLARARAALSEEGKA